MEQTNFNLAIIGGGPGGYVAAERAAAAGLKVVLFEKGSLGGVCLNEGCIPTKSLLFSAKQLENARGADKFGINVTDAVPDFTAIMARKKKVVKKLVAGVKAAMKAGEVQVVNEQAYIEGKSGDGFAIKAGEESYVAANLLVCSGSEATVPPIPGISDAVLTSREILELEELPQRLTIIGGGVIGMEFAAFFCAMGTEVTVVEMLPKILGPMDQELSAMLQKQYEKRGVKFHLGCRVTALEGAAVLFETPEGESCRVEGDKVLLSVGRRAVLEGFGLENLAPEMTLGRSGKPVGIKVDAQMRTSVPGLYAAGDVTGFSMLAHTASREGEVAVNTILGKRDTMRYDAIPGVVYTHPEVAGVGLTEAEAAAKGVAVKVVKLPLAYSGRFVAETERGEGLCKIVADAASQKVLGVHILGGPAGEIIGAAAMAITQGMTLQELQKVIFPHPTVVEILKEAAFQA